MMGCNVSDPGLRLHSPEAVMSTVSMRKPTAEREERDREIERESSTEQDWERETVKTAGGNFSATADAELYFVRTKRHGGLRASC